MGMNCWVLVTDAGWAGLLNSAKPLAGRTTAVVVGSRELAEAVAAAGPDEVRWVDCAPGTPIEAYAASVADLAAEAAPHVLISSADPSARVLLGAAAARFGARLIPGMVGLDVDDGALRVHRSVAGGETVETLLVDIPAALIHTGDDTEPVATSSTPVTAVGVVAAALSVVASEPVGSASGLDDAERVVSFGRGVRARDDVTLIRQLAGALDAEIACTMPIADDLGWLERSRYVGRSGQHIAPRLYLAVGIGGAPQHLEGVRGARIVAAINSDPEARIFRTADYGIVGDLYEVVPALISATNQ